jgi:hypothetical protein
MLRIRHNFPGSATLPVPRNHGERWDFIFSMSAYCYTIEGHEIIQKVPVPRTAVLRIRDVYPGSEFISISDPESKRFRFLDPDPHQNNLSILTQKIISKLSGNMNRGVHPGSGSWFFYPSRIQGSKRHRIPDPQFTAAQDLNAYRIHVGFMLAERRVWRIKRVQKAPDPGSATLPYMI